MVNNTVEFKGDKLEENVIVFSTHIHTDNPKEVIRFAANGDVFVKEKLVVNDMELVEGFRDFLDSQGFYQKPTS